MKRKTIGSTGVLFPMLVVVIAQPTLAQDEPVIHQTLFAKAHVFDGTSDKLAMGCEIVWRSIRRVG